MKRLFLIFAITAVLAGCSPLRPFTPISFVEIQGENIRSYHIRYPGGAAGEFNLHGKLFMIEGVQSVYPKLYEFTVIRSSVYSWNEIEDKIKVILLKFETEIKAGHIGKIINERSQKKDGV